MPEVNDNPIATREDGSPIFDNTPTVVCMCVHNSDGRLIAVRRNNEPGKGLIGLPGGYHMRGETWQEAGARELFEETGYVIDPEGIETIVDPVTDEYGNNVIFAGYVLNSDPDFDNTVRDTSFVTPDEVQEVLHLDLYDLGSVEEWAFPLHHDVAISL